MTNTTAGGDKADALDGGLKYDANNIYLAAMYSETRNMTPYGDNTDAVANKTQNFELNRAVPQFDFGLRPAISYLQSKGKDLANGQGDQDLVKYADVGATYYFNKNMSTYVDYKINLKLDEDDNLQRHNGISTDDVIASNGSFRKVLVEAKLRESRLDCADSPFFIKDNCVVCSSILNRTDSFSLFVDGVDF